MGVRIVVVFVGEENDPGTWEAAAAAACDLVETALKRAGLAASAESVPEEEDDLQKRIHRRHSSEP